MIPRQIIPLAWAKEVGEYAGMITAGIGAFIAFTAMVRKVHRTASKATATYDRLTLLADTFTPEMVANLTIIATQMKPNGGSSVYDKLTRIDRLLVYSTEARRQQFNATGIAFWEADEQGHTVFVSDRAAQIMGLLPEQALGNGWVTTLASEDRPRVCAEWQASIEQKRNYISVHTYVHADGERVQVQARAHPICDSTGKTIGIVGTLLPGQWERISP